MLNYLSEQLGKYSYVNNDVLFFFNLACIYKIKVMDIFVRVYVKRVVLSNVPRWRAFRFLDGSPMQCVLFCKSRLLLL